MGSVFITASYLLTASSYLEEQKKKKRKRRVRVRESERHPLIPGLHLPGCPHFCSRCNPWYSKWDAIFIYFSIRKCSGPARHPPLLFDEFLGTLDLFVELLDLLVMAEALLVIRVELQALADLAGEREEERGRRRRRETVVCEQI